MSKYNNNKVGYEFQGEVYRFDSSLERDHAIQLFKELKEGKISNLILQREFVLCVPTELLTNSTKNGKTKQRSVKYISDFSYMKDGKHIVSDSKGVKTSSYSIKKRLLLSQLKEHSIDEFQELYRSETITYKGL